VVGPMLWVACRRRGMANPVTQPTATSHHERRVYGRPRRAKAGMPTRGARGSWHESNPGHACMAWSGGDASSTCEPGRMHAVPPTGKRPIENRRKTQEEIKDDRQEEGLHQLRLRS
jgi:hypothetical protein